MIKRFFDGFGFIIEGKRTLSRVPGLGRWILIPWLLDVGLLGAGIYFGAEWVQRLANSATAFIIKSTDMNSLSVVVYILLFVFWLVFAVLLFFLVYLFASVSSAPFYSVMAEKILVHKGTLRARPFSLSWVIKNSLRMLWVSILRAFILVLVGSVVFVVSFLPGLNLLSTFLVFVILSLDSADYALEAMGFGLRSRLRFFLDNFVEFCGMGAFVALTAMIPGLIVLLMPFAVLGATNLVGERILSNPKESEYDSRRTT